jgi:hypothetical protein
MASTIKGLAELLKMGPTRPKTKPAISAAEQPTIGMVSLIDPQPRGSEIQMKNSSEATFAAACPASVSLIGCAIGLAGLRYIWPTFSHTWGMESIDAEAAVSTWLSRDARERVAMR